MLAYNSSNLFYGSRILESDLKTDFSHFIAKALHIRYFSEEKKIAILF